MPIDVAAAVVANTRLSDEYNVVALDAPSIARDALPGQFVMLKPSAGTDPLLRRPFSIFEILRDEAGQPAGVSILNKRIGVGTRLLFDVRPGSHVACLGPLGLGFPVPGLPQTPDALPSEAWMIAGGVGLAPFATLAEALAARRVPATLFYGGRRASDLFYVDWFERLGVRVILTTEDGSRGERGLVTAPLARALESGATGRIVTLYACGPTPMMAAVAALGRKYGRPVLVSLEQTMGCGLGGCYSCVVPFRRNGSAHFVRSCIDGPVFDSNLIVWDELHR
jgi:dihydroorotate dehydrogenase electron transfer subunit